MDTNGRNLNLEAAEISQQVARTSPHGRSSLPLEWRSGSRSSQQLVISRDANDSGAPLSFAQERLWFLDLLQPGSSAYILACCVRLPGALDIEAFKRAFYELLCRHETLRTTFPLIDGSPVQAVGEPPSLDLPLFELIGLDNAPRRAEVIRIAREMQQPFDLQCGPLVRAALLRLQPDEYAALLTMHHMVSDGWSIGILAHELTTLYQAFASGKPSPLNDLPIRYSDFARWQRSRLTGEALDRELEYWKKQLAGISTLNLPTDYPRAKLQSLRGAGESRVLQSPLSTQIKVWAQAERVTLFMMFLAAFQILLARYSGQQDIAVGFPVAGRTAPQTERLIGLFANTLVLRSDLSGNPTFRELLARVRAVTLGALEHQDAPFEKLVEVLRPERDLSRSPLFQVMFNFESVRAEKGTAPGSFIPLPMDSAAKFDLALTVVERANLFCYVQYNADLFEAATIQRMLGHLEVLITAAVAHPDQHISDLPLLTAEEWRQLVIERNQTRVPQDEPRCVHELFESQAERRPDAIAVTDEKHSITYGELNQRAHQLAHYLRRRGVGAGTLVGVCLERSIAMVEALLGIWKAGAAYVPLDPAYPPERLKFMLQDSGARLVITQEPFGRIFSGSSAEILDFEKDGRVVEKETPENVEWWVSAEDPAYVIYTSGSTGQPKGVEILHRSVTNLLESMKQEPGMEERDTLLAITTLSFDIAVLELFLPLSTGGHLVIASREVAADPGALQKAIKTLAPTVMQATPATWGMLVESGWDGDKQLKILCGGEALSRELANKLVERAREVWNMYGPTETTIWSSTGRLRREEGSVPLGTPIANTEFYVLDGNRHAVPFGVPGELYIGGAGLARGYWKRSELTGEKFVPHPFSDEPGQRLYRTGDLVRHHADGRIEYLSRIDNQVKVRGYRIELGEIEAALREQPGVRECVVIEREDSPGEKRLVAYLVGAKEDIPATGELRARLKQKLPEYMIPGATVILDALPLTPSGKVNRLALPRPEFGELEPDAAFLEPRDELELELAGIWRQLLRRQRIGVKDNFFELGGHSLLAVRLFVEIERLFGRKLPLASLFLAPTVEQLASLMREGGWSPLWSSLVPLQVSGRAAPFFCIHSLGSNLVSYRRLAHFVGENQPFYGLQPKGLDGKSEAHTRVEDMATHYLEEIMRVQPHGPYSLGGVCLGGVVAFEMAQQLVARGEQVEKLVLIDSHFPSDPKHFTTRAFRLGLLARADVHLGEILVLPRKEKIAYVLERVRKVASTGLRRLQDMIGIADSRPAEDGDFARVLKKVRAANALAEATYVPKFYPGRVTLLWCTGMATRSYQDRRLGWSDVAGGGLEVQAIPGNHMSMVEEPHIETMAAKLRACLQGPPTSS